MECLIISACTPLVSTALNLSQVDHGVVEFLHRERRHRVLELVAVALVFLFVCGVELLE